MAVGSGEPAAPGPAGARLLGAQPPRGHPPIPPYVVSSEERESTPAHTPRSTRAIATAAAHDHYLNSIYFYDPPTIPLRGAIVDSDRIVMITA